MVDFFSSSIEVAAINGFRLELADSPDGKTAERLKPLGIKLEVCDCPRGDLEGDYLELQREHNDHSVFIKTGPKGSKRYIYFHAEYKYGWVIDSTMNDGQPIAYLGGSPSSRLPHDPSNKLPYTYWRVLKGSMGIFNMDYVMKINRVWSGSGEKKDLSGSQPAEDVHAEVREMIEIGFSKFKEWLDVQLQQQEQLLQCIRHECKTAHNNVAPSCIHIASTETQTEACEFDDCELPEFLPAPEQIQSQTQAASAFCPSQTPMLSGTGTFPQPKERLTKAEQDWQSTLMDIFDQLDCDGSGCIDSHEFMDAFAEAGMPDIQAFKIFDAMDETDNGTIGRLEWLHLIDELARGSEDEIKLLEEFLQRLTKLQRTRGGIYTSGRKQRRSQWILRHDSAVRMTWDFLLCILLFYVSISVPFSLGFGQSNILDIINLVCDVFFCCDVVLNFRTSYVDSGDDAVIVDGRKIACKYLKSWFILDFFSSVPFDLITGGLLPNLTPARLLKLGKISKVMKLMRVSKLTTVLQDSEMLETVDQILTSRAYQTSIRIAKLACLAFIVAHWLACFGSAIDNSSLDVYFTGEAPTVLQKYLAGIYWAMTTLSTVGYGDITPKSDEERAYAMIAMVVGGSMYGYVIGSVTSIVTDLDVSAHAYHERLELLHSWLASHDEIPPLLRRRLRKHFRRALAAKSAVEDSAVVLELSPELRADTAFFLINDHVKRHPMFANISNSTLAKLVEVLQRNHANAHERVVRYGDPGIAMYILVHGVARYEYGAQWVPPEEEAQVRLSDVALKSVSSARFQQVAAGDSFGEEIIFGLAETYVYTIIALADCEFHTISEDGFRERYENMPELRDQMFSAWMNSRKLQHQEELMRERASRHSDRQSSKPKAGHQPYHCVLPQQVPEDIA